MAAHVSKCTGTDGAALRRRIDQWEVAVIRMTSIIALGLLGACAPEVHPSPFSAVETKRYGWGSMADSTRPLTDVERTYGGGVLGDVLDIDEASDGRLYALDAGFKKIVVFSADGSLDRVIVGGAGEGPGEFMRPRSISVDATGNIWVFDQLSSRITKFDSAGTVVHTFSVAMSGVIDIVAKGANIYAARAADSASSGIVVFDTLGTRVASVLTPTADDLRLGGRRPAFSVGKGSGNALLVGHGSVGVWRTIADSQPSDQRGSIMFPELIPRTVAGPDGKPMLNILVYNWGIGAWPDGHIVLYYIFSGNADPPNTGKHMLGLFDRSGSYVGSVEVPSDRGTFGVGSRANDVFVVQSEPYPQIVRLAVSR